jgi:hypothetical protein
LVFFSVLPEGVVSDDLMLARPAILRHCQLAPKHPLDNLTTLIEAETFQVKIHKYNQNLDIFVDLIHQNRNLDLDFAHLLKISTIRICIKNCIFKLSIQFD